MATIATLEVLFRSNQAAFIQGLKGVEGGLVQAKAASEAMAVSMRGLLVAGAVAGIAKEFVDLGGAALGVAADLETTKVSFTRLLGSAEAADTRIREMWEFARSTPFEFTQLVDAEKRLLAMGFAANDLIPTLRIVGDTTAALGNPEAMNRIVIAFGQIKNSATLMKQDLNQLTQAGIPAVQILHEKLGLTMQQIANVGKQHVNSATALKAIMEGMQERYGGMMEAQSKTLNGMLSNAKDNIVELGATIGEQLLPPAKAVVESFNFWVGALNKSVQAAKDLVDATKNIDTAASDASLHLSNQMIHMINAAKALQAFKGAEAIGIAMKSGTGSVSDQRVDSDVMSQLGDIANPAFAGSRSGGAGGPMDVLMDEFGNLIGETQALEDSIGELDAWTATLHDGFAGMDTDLDYFGQGVKASASGMDRLKEAQGTLIDDVFKVAQRFTSLDDAIKKLSVSIVIDSESIDSLFPKLKDAGDLFQKMNQQIRDVTVGEGPGALSAFHSIVAQNEASMRLLAFMEATGQGVQEMGTTMGQGADVMDTAFDDLLASFSRSTAAIHANAEAAQVVADVQMQSVAMGMAGASAAAGAVDTGLMQLGAGLQAYGQMAATGTLPGGLPGGNPFDGMGIRINEGGGFTGGTGNESITNPNAGGTPWGGGLHGFAPGGPSQNWGGGITITFSADAAGFDRWLGVRNAAWAGQNSVGQR